MVVLFCCFNCRLQYIPHSYFRIFSDILQIKYYGLKRLMKSLKLEGKKKKSGIVDIAVQKIINIICM